MTVKVIWYGRKDPWGERFLRVKIGNAFSEYRLEQRNIKDKRYIVWVKKQLIGMTMDYLRKHNMSI